MDDKKEILHRDLPFSIPNCLPFLPPPHPKIYLYHHVWALINRYKRSLLVVNKSIINKNGDQRWKFNFENPLKLKVVNKIKEILS